MLTMTSVEAQNRFGQLLDAAQREPVAITRHGRKAAFIVSPQDMAELTNARNKSSNPATAPTGIDWMLQQPLQTGGEAGTSADWSDR
jgi:prevent-host-death family protein